MSDPLQPHVDLIARLLAQAHAEHPQSLSVNLLHAAADKLFDATAPAHPELVKPAGGTGKPPS